MRCLCCRVDVCVECWDKIHGVKNSTYNEIIQEHLPGVPLGESTQMIAQLASRSVNVVNSENEGNIYPVVEFNFKKGDGRDDELCDDVSAFEEETSGNEAMVIDDVSEGEQVYNGVIDDVVAQQIDATLFTDGDLDFDFDDLFDDLFDCSLQSLQNATMVSDD